MHWSIKFTIVLDLEQWYFGHINVPAARGHRVPAISKPLIMHNSVYPFGVSMNAGEVSTSDISVH